MTSQKLIAEQYRDSSNLDVRIGFHERFSINKYPWMRWVFDHFEFPPSCYILELGCGAGNLWVENSDRIREDWEIVISDASPGMLDKARQAA